MHPILTFSHPNTYKNYYSTGFVKKYNTRIQMHEMCFDNVSGIGQLYYIYIYFTPWVSLLLLFRVRLSRARLITLNSRERIII